MIFLQVRKNRVVLLVRQHRTCPFCLFRGGGFTRVRFPAPVFVVAIGFTIPSRRRFDSSRRIARQFFDLRDYEHEHEAEDERWILHPEPRTPNPEP